MMGKALSASFGHIDTLCFDLEDSVASSKKQFARQLLRNWLYSDEVDKNKLNRKNEWLVRINPLDSGLALDDLSAILMPNDNGDDPPCHSGEKSLRRAQNWPDGIVVPKVESGEQLLRLFGYLETFQTIRNNALLHHEQLTRQSRDKDVNQSTLASQHNDFVVIALIESAQALLNLPLIAAAGKPYLKAMILGGDDLAASLGATRSKENTELLYARQRMISVAKAHQLQAIDIVNIDLKDLTRLEEESREGFQFGMTGKQCIHPSQVDIIQSSFSPSKEKIEWARRLIAESQTQSQKGIGAFVFEGRMVDLPTIKSAQQIVEFASIM